MISTIFFAFIIFTCSSIHSMERKKRSSSLKPVDVQNIDVKNINATEQLMKQITTYLDMKKFMNVVTIIEVIHAKFGRDYAYPELANLLKKKLEENNSLAAAALMSGNIELPLEVLLLLPPQGCATYQNHLCKHNPKRGSEIDAMLAELRNPDKKSNDDPATI